MRVLRHHIRVILFVVLGCVYCLLFVPPNLVGTKDPQMLAAFQLDEYVQYGTVTRMTSLGATPLATLINVVVYRHYFYGYPFYVVSALTILPVKLILSLAGVADPTMGLMLVLRQLSPLFVISSIVLVIWMWTAFRDLVRSLFLFAFLGFIPVVVFNNLWWHPDGLVTLFVTLTIFSLYRDNLAFGRWFYLAAVFCGLAAGTKVVGVFFFLTIGVYLLLGIRRRSINSWQLCRHGAGYLLAMALTIIVTNPLLLIPQTAEQIIGTMIIRQATVENSSQGGLQSATGFLAWYNETLWLSFGFWWLYLIALAACVVGIVYNPQKRLLNIIILTWALPYTLYVILFVAYKKGHYFIPTFLPLLSCIANPVIWDVRAYMRARRWASLAAAVAAIGGYLVQASFYIPANISTYQAFLNRERDSQALSFYYQFHDAYLALLPANTRLTVFRDPYIYLPPLDHFDVHMKWGGATYADIEQIKPELIILQKSYIERYVNPEIARNNQDRQAAQESGVFYYDAQQDQLKGFRKVFETPFGIAFRRNP